MSFAALSARVILLVTLGCSGASAAEIIVTLPAEAKLIVNGQAMSTTGPVRRFRDSRAMPGETYRYNMRATTKRDGLVLAVDKVVRLRAGERADIAFEFDEVDRAATFAPVAHERVMQSVVPMQTPAWRWQFVRGSCGQIIIVPVAPAFEQTSGRPDYYTMITELRNDFTALENVVNNLQSNTSNLQNEIANVRTSVQTGVFDIRSELTNIRNGISAVQNQVNTIQQDVNQLKPGTARQ